MEQKILWWEISEKVTNWGDISVVTLSKSKIVSIEDGK